MAARSQQERVHQALKILSGIIIMITATMVVSFQPLKRAFDDNSHQRLDIASGYYHPAVLSFGRTIPLFME